MDELKFLIQCRGSYDCYKGEEPRESVKTLLSPMDATEESFRLVFYPLFAEVVRLNDVAEMDESIGCIFYCCLNNELIKDLAYDLGYNHDNEMALGVK